MVAAAIIGGSVISAGASAYGSRQAGNQAQRGSDAAAAESARQFNLIRSDTAPLRSIQGSALNSLARLYGWNTPAPQGAATVGGGATRLPPKLWNDPAFEGVPQVERPQPQATPSGAAGAPDASAFFESPDYQFNLQEGQRAIDRSLASRGRALSGAGVREGTRFASGMASSEYGNFVNRLLAAAGLGTTGVTTSAQAGMTSAGQIGAAQQNAGNARASAYMSGAQGVNNAVQGGISNMMMYQYLQRPQGVG